MQGGVVAASNSGGIGWDPASILRYVFDDDVGSEAFCGSFRARHIPLSGARPVMSDKQWDLVIAGAMLSQRPPFLREAADTTKNSLAADVPLEHVATDAPLSPSPLSSPDAPRRVRRSEVTSLVTTMEVLMTKVMVTKAWMDVITTTTETVEQPKQSKKKKLRNRPGKKTRQRQSLDSPRTRTTSSPSPRGRSRSPPSSRVIITTEKKKREKSRSKSKRVPPKNVCYEWKQAGKSCTRSSPKHRRQFNHDPEWENYYN